MNQIICVSQWISESNRYKEQSTVEVLEDAWVSCASVGHPWPWFYLGAKSVSPVCPGFSHQIKCSRWNILRHLSVENSRGAAKTFWAELDLHCSALFENNMCQLPSPPLKPTLWTFHLLYACILSLYSMIQICIYTARHIILPRMERCPNLKRGTYRSRHTRNYVFASRLVAGLEGREPHSHTATLPHCHMAKYILYIIIIYYIVLLYIIK